MHLSFVSPGADPGDTHGNPGTVMVFLFCPRGGELRSFENEFAGPRGHTHGIWSWQWDRQGEKCFIWFDGRAVKMSKRRAKKFHTLACYCKDFMPFTKGL